MINDKCNELYEMKLSEILIIEDSNLFTTVLRVPGGWVYRSYDKGHQILSSVFVPFNKEFKKSKKAEPLPPAVSGVRF